MTAKSSAFGLGEAGTMYTYGQSLFRLGVCSGQLENSAETAPLPQCHPAKVSQIVGYSEVPFSAKVQMTVTAFP